MAPELLASAYGQALASAPELRVAALLRIARVQTALDRGQARRTFSQALEEIRRIQGRESAFFLEHARLFAAAVAPDRLAEIPAEHRRPRHFEAQLLGKTMIEHGNLEAARDLLTQCDNPSTFPFAIAGMLIERSRPEEGLVILRLAVEAWRNGHGALFIWLFQHRWKSLPEEEAREIVREIVRAALEEPDKTTQATYDQEGTIRITSNREHTLFQVLHVLRHLDPPLAESLLASHAQLAAAARRFPYGVESMLQEAEERKKAAGASGGGGGFGFVGSSDDFPFQRALMQAAWDGDFEPAFEHAEQQYRTDAAPESRNQAPVEFWPSAGRFRSVIYAAGKRLGTDASRYLDRIEDPGIRLLAQIELAAALAGLPEFHGVQRQHRPRSGRISRPMPEAALGPPVLGPNGETIRCPKCNWVPHANHRWLCKCGHSWNTFETGGACPECRHQWNVTACLACREISPHSDWYVSAK